MNISTIQYSQSLGTPDEWHLKDVKLGRLNIITGRNAVGKTRTVNILNALAGASAGRNPRLLDGNWYVTFDNHGKEFSYTLRVLKGKIEKEQIKEDGMILLNRQRESGYIFRFKGKEKSKESFGPPINKLTHQVRRDVKQYPFIEDLVHWGENYHSFSFGKGNPTMFSIPANMRQGNTVSEGASWFPEDLSLVPYLLKEISGDVVTKKKIISDLKKVGYEVKDLDTIEVGAAMGASLIRVVEKNINFPISQQQLSSGMFRVIAMIITLNYLIGQNNEGTIVIDDLCEGLDFGRSSNLARLIFKEIEKSKIQLIATTNDMFLMNSVDLECWNIFERRGNRVKSFNYKSNKEVFDEFKLIGISNFDFFSNRLYKGLKKDE